MSDCYIVLDGTRVVMASMSLQGAENIRTDYARREALEIYPEDDAVSWRQLRYRSIYDRMRIVNTELEDSE